MKKNLPSRWNPCRTFFFALACFAATARGAELFSEAFNLQSEAHVGTNNGADGTVTFVDYSAMTVGAVTHNIPEAPRQIAGSLPARGVLLQVLYGAATAAERIVNLVALDDAGGSRLQFTDNYRLKFDVYLRLSPGVTIHPSGFPNETGTTEQVIWGVGYSATQPMSRGTRTTRGGTGMWGWLTTEGGSGVTNGSDAALCNTGSVVGGRNMDTSSADLGAFFTPAFGADAFPVPHCPANQWVEADITVSTGLVTVEYKAAGAGRTKTKFYQNIAGPVAGSVMVGYEDAFASVTFDPDNQWMLLDNMVVEDLALPTMMVSAGTPFTTYTGTPVTGTYSINNTRTAGDLTISAVSFSGAGAPAFSLATPMPLVIGPGVTAPLEIMFSPAAPDGIKTASITIASDDPQTPNYVIADVRARRSVGSFFEAHYKLDETSGTSLADSSGNGPNATLQLGRDSVIYGQPSLLGAADTGTAMGIPPAQTSGPGNFITSTVVHTPTFSISLWMKPSPAGPIRTLFQRDNDSQSPYDKHYALLLTAGGTIRYLVRSTDILESDPLTPVADDTVWHVVMTHLDEDGFGNDTATRSRLYINGLLAAEKAGDETKGFDDYPIPNPAAFGLYFGTRTIAGHGFAGDFDDLQIYGVELSREQVWELFKRPGAAASRSFDILTVTRSSAPDALAVTVPSSPQGTYRLFRSDDLQGWEAAGASVAGDATSIFTRLVDSVPPATNQFYRVQRE